MYGCGQLALLYVYILLLLLIKQNADEQSRVKLNQKPGVDGSDYINASFIDVSIGLLYLCIYHYGLRGVPCVKYGWCVCVCVCPAVTFILEI